MSGPSALEPGRIVAGRYRVERQIGAGGVGSVYLVRHVHTDEELALKVLQSHVLGDAGAVERFRKEARAPARIGGEHVTRVTDADTAPDLDNAPFLVMELLRGRDLTDVVADRGPLAPGLVLELVRQVGRALDRAHALGIVHRDLKPDNLFLTERDDGSPCIKLLDFGIARIGDVAPGAMKTQAGLVFGTPGYMAPEQMTGEVDLVSPATDVWALGLVAFYLLVGHDFWEATTLTRLYATILSEPIPLPSQRGSALGDPFDVWFGRCVQRDPAARFQTAGEAVLALPVALGLRSSTPPVSLPPRDRVERAPSRPDLPPLLPPVLPPFVASPGMASTPPPVVAASAEDGRGTSRAVVAVAGGALAMVLVAGAAVAWVELMPHDDASRVAASAPPAMSAPPETASPPPTVPAPRASAPPVRAAVDTSARAAEPMDEPPPPPAATAQPAAPARAAWDPRVRGSTREQQERLDALQRLCDQGTVTAAECAAKRGAILRGDP